ncbi:MAG: hypothetical protein LBM59_02425 [Ruminococcus sp.]|jgi:hypothetical protein|nr:hypothetical protein [Ruminococcus sp.]
MPNITVTNNNAQIKALKLPGVIITGKGRNAIKAEFEGSGLNFKAKILENFDKNISRLIVVATEDYKEAMKYILAAESENIPHVLITTTVNANYCIKFLHIMYTDDRSLNSAVKAAVADEEFCEIPESYLLFAEAEGEYRLEAVFSDIFDRLPSFDFSNLIMRISTHPSENIERPFIKKFLPNLMIERIDTDKLQVISAEIIGF